MWAHVERHFEALVLTACAAVCAALLLKILRPAEGFEMGASLGTNQALVNAIDARVTQKMAENDKKREEAEAWTNMHENVFESYVRVNGMAPTDIAMRHYLFKAKRLGLSKDAIVKLMTADLPASD